MYTMEHDPITGEELYRSIQTGNVSSRKPLILGSERWDPDDMLQWNVDEVMYGVTGGDIREHTSTEKGVSKNPPFVSERVPAGKSSSRGLSCSFDSI